MRPWSIFSKISFPFFSSHLLTLYSHWNCTRLSDVLNGIKSKCLVEWKFFIERRTMEKKEISYGWMNRWKIFLYIYFFASFIFYFVLFASMESLLWKRNWKLINWFKEKKIQWVSMSFFPWISLQFFLYVVNLQFNCYNVSYDDEMFDKI